MTDFEILMGESPEAAPLEIQSYSEWSRTTPPDDEIQGRKDFADYLREEYIRADQYSADIENEIRTGLQTSLVQEGQIDPEDDEAFASLYQAPERTFDEKVDLIQSTIGYKDPDWDTVTRYKALNKVATTDPDVSVETMDKLEASKKQVEQIVGNRFDDVKRTMVNNGELAFAVVTGVDGTPEFIAGDRAVKSDLLSALKDSKIGGVQLSDAYLAQDQLSTQQGTDLPKYKYNRLREAHDMILELAEEDESLRYQISGHGTRLARSEYDKNDAWEMFLDDAGQDITDAAGWLIGKVMGSDQDERTAEARKERARIAQAGSAFFDEATKELARRLNNVEGIRDSDAFSLEEVQTAYKQVILNDANANNKFEFHDGDDEVGKNIRTYGYLGPTVHPAAMANKDVFDRMLAARPDIDDSVKKTLATSRTAFLENNFSDMSDLLSRSGQSDEWTAALTKGRANGQANHEILSDFLADEENYNEFAERTKGIAWSLWDSVTQLAAAVPAAFGAEWAQDTLVNSARRNSDRREVAKLFGEDFGFFQDIGETIAPMVVDVAATSLLAIATAPAAGAGGAAYLAARQGARFTAKGLGKALTSSAFRATSKESTEAAAERLVVEGLIKQSVNDAGSEGALAAIKGYNSLFAKRAGIAAASFVPAATRSGGATYGTLFNELQKNTDLSREEIHDRALGGALMAGAFTGFITAGFGALGRGGVEDALLKGMSFKKLSSTLKSVANSKGINDQTVALAMSQQLKAQLKQYKFSGAKSLLQNVVDEGQEEALDEFINGFIVDAVLEENTPMLERMSQSLYAGALGGVMGAGVPAVQRVAQKIRVDPIGQVAASARLQQDFYEGVASRLEGTDSPLTAEAVRLLSQTAARRRSRSVPPSEIQVTEEEIAERFQRETIDKDGGIRTVFPELSELQKIAEEAGLPTEVEEGVEDITARTQLMQRIVRAEKAEATAPATSAAPVAAVAAGAAPVEAEIYGFVPSSGIQVTEEDINRRFPPDLWRNATVEELQKIAEEAGLPTEVGEGVDDITARSQLMQRIVRAEKAEKIAEVATPSATARPTPTGPDPAPVVADLAGAPDFSVAEATEAPAATFGATDESASSFLVKLNDALNTDEGMLRLQRGINDYVAIEETVDISGEGKISLPMTPFVEKDFSDLTFRLGSERRGVVAQSLGVDQMEVVRDETGRLSLVNPLPDLKRPKIAYVETRPTASLQGVDVSEVNHFDLGAFKAADEINEVEMAEALEYATLAVRFGAPVRLSASARFGLPASGKFSDKSDFLAKVVYDRYPILQVDLPDGGKTFTSSRKKTFFDPSTGKKKVDGKIKGFVDQHGRGVFNNDPITVAEMLAHNIPVEAPPEGFENLNPAFKVRGGWVVDVMRPTLDGQLKESMVSPIDKISSTEANHTIAYAYAGLPFIEDGDKVLPKGSHGVTADGGDLVRDGMTISDLDLQLEQFFIRYKNDPSQFDSFMDFYGDEGSRLDDVAFREAALNGAAVEFRRSADLFELRSHILDSRFNLTATVGDKTIVAPSKKRAVVKEFMSRMRDGATKKVVANRLLPLISVKESESPTNSDIIIRFVEERVLNNSDFEGGSMPTFTKIVRRNVDRYLSQQESRGIHETNASIVSMQDQDALDAVGIQNIENHALYVGGQDTSAPLSPQVFASAVKKSLDDAVSHVLEDPDLKDALADLSFQSIYPDPDPAMVSHVMLMLESEHGIKQVMNSIGGWMATNATNPEAAEFVQLLESGRFRSGLDLKDSLRLSGLANRADGDPTKDEESIEATREMLASLGEGSSRVEAINFIKAMDQSIRRRLSRSHLTEAQRAQAAIANGVEIEFLGLESGNPESVVAALKKIVESSENPNHKLVAEMLLEDEAFILNVGFSMGTSNLEIAGEYVRGADGTHRVFINTDSGNGRGLENVLLEEYVHAFLSDTINKTENQLTSKQLAARKRLEGLHALAMEQYVKSGQTNAFLEDGLSNMDEFVASFLLSPEFQYHIKTLDTPNGQRGFFRRVMEAIASMFRKVTPTEGEKFADAMEDILDLGRTTHRNNTVKFFTGIAQAAADATGDANTAAPKVSFGFSLLNTDIGAFGERARLEAQREETPQEAIEREESIRDKNLADSKRDLERQEQDPDPVVRQDVIGVLEFLNRKLPSIYSSITLDRTLDAVAKPDVETDTIVFNPDRLADLIEGLEPAAQRNIAYKIAHEELAHIASFRALTNADIDTIIEELSDEDFDKIAVDYQRGNLNPEAREANLKNIRDNLASEDASVVRDQQRYLVEEKLRMQLQKATKGATTEEDIQFWSQKPSLLSILKRYISSVINRMVANRRLSREPHGALDSAIHALMNEMVAIEANFDRSNKSVALDPNTPAEVLDTYLRALDLDPITEFSDQGELEAVAFDLASSATPEQFNGLSRASRLQMVRGKEFIQLVPLDAEADGYAEQQESALRAAEEAAREAQTTGFRNEVDFAERLSREESSIARIIAPSVGIGSTGDTPFNFGRQGYGLAFRSNTPRTVSLESILDMYADEVMAGLSHESANEIPPLNNPTDFFERNMGPEGIALYEKLKREHEAGESITLPPLSVPITPTKLDDEQQRAYMDGDMTDDQKDRMFTVVNPYNYQGGYGLDEDLSDIEKHTFNQTFAYLAFFNDLLDANKIELDAPVPIMLGVTKDETERISADLNYTSLSSPELNLYGMNVASGENELLDFTLGLSEERSLAELGRGTPVSAGAGINVEAFEKALESLSSDERQILIEHSDSQTVRFLVRPKFEDGSVDTTSGDRVTIYFKDGGEIEVYSMFPIYGSKHKMKGTPISMLLLRALILHNNEVGATKLTTQGIGDGSFQQENVIFKSVVDNSGIKEMMREAIIKHRQADYFQSLEDPHEGLHENAAIEETLREFYYELVGEDARQASDTGYKTWPSFGFEPTPEEVERIEREIEQYKDSRIGWLRTAEGADKTYQNIVNSLEDKIIDFARKHDISLPLLKEAFGVESPATANEVFSKELLDRMVRASEDARAKIRNELERYFDILEQAGDESGKSRYDLFAAMHLDFAGDNDNEASRKAANDRKRFVRNAWSKFGHTTYYQFDLREGSESVQAVVRRKPFLKLVETEDIKQLRPKYNREVMAARKEHGDNTPAFEQARQQIADKYNSQLHERGHDFNAFSSAGGRSQPLTGHNLANIPRLLELPMFEDASYKAPKGFLNRLFKGDLFEVARRLLEQRDEYGRASTDLLSKYKKKLDDLVVSAYGSSMSPDAAKDVAMAQGYPDPDVFIDGNLVSDATLSKLDKEHNDRRRAINQNTALTLAQKEVQIKASLHKRDTTIESLEQAAKSKVLADQRAALKRIEQKSPKLAAHIIDMREQFIRPLQEKMKTTGITDPLKVKIDDTGGFYLTRAYAMFTDPTYAARVKADPAYKPVRDAASRLFEKQFFFHHLNAAKDQGKSDTEARRIARDELDKANKSALASGVTTTYGDQMVQHVLDQYDGDSSGDPAAASGFKVIENNLKKRKDLPREFRDLLGEFGPEVGTDLIIRTATTVSTITAQQSFLKNLADLGLKNGWMVNASDFAADPDRYPDYVPVRRGTPSSNDPLKHMYAPKELVDSLETVLGSAYLGKATSTAQEAVGAMANVAQKLTGKAMVAKTLGSVGFYFRNMLGNVLFFGPAQGFGRLDKMLGQSLAHTFQKMKDPDKLDAELSELIGLGVIGDEVRAGIMRELLDGKAAPETVLAKLDEFTDDIIAVSQGKKAMQWLEKKAIDLSASVDGAFKIAYFEHEFRYLLRAAKKYPNSKLGKMLQKPDGEYLIKREAARKVKMTAQSLSQAPPIVTAMSRSQFGILFAPFLRFKAEVPRIVINTYKLGMEEIRSDNPLVRRRGAVRMGAMTGMTGIVSAAIPATMAAISGIGEEEDEALRKSMPTYLRGHTFWIRRDEDGSLKSMDLTYLNPFSLLVDPTMRAIENIRRGELGKAGAAFASGMIFDTYLDDQILAGAVSSVLQNKDATTDREIWVPEVDGAGSAMLKSLGYIFKEAYEPRILKDALQAREAIGGDYSEFSDSPLGELLDGAYPVKVHSIDLEQQYRRFLRDHTRRAKLVSDNKYRLYNKRPIGDEEIAELYDDEIEGRRALNDELLRIARGFDGLGLPAPTQYKLMTSSGIGKQKAQLMFYGAMDRTAINKKFMEGLYRRNLQHRLKPLLERMEDYPRYIPIEDPE